MRARLRVVVLFGPAVAALLAPATTLGQDQANDHFAAGVRLFGREEYADALREFQAARDVRETASVTLNIAGCLHALFRHAEALGAYQHFLELRGARLTTAERRRVDRAIADLRGRVAELTVTTNVPDAEVLVGGRPAHGPVLLDPGAEVLVEARREGFRPASTSARPTAPGPLAMALTLERLPRIGRLHLTASVRAAQVAIDGRAVGPAPWTGELEAGPHELRVDAEGYERYSRTIEIAAGQDLRHEATLSGAVPAVDDAPVHPRVPREQTGGSALPWVIGGASALAAIGAGVLVFFLASEPLEGDRMIEGP